MKQVGRNTSAALASVQSKHFSVEVNVNRNPAFKVLGDSDVSHFESILAKGSVITDEKAIEPSNSDWTRKFTG
jgi:hypothetical protein